MGLAAVYVFSFVSRLKKEEEEVKGVHFPFFPLTPDGE